LKEDFQRLTKGLTELRRNAVENQTGGLPRT